MNAVMPRGSPGVPDVRAKTRSCDARCMPELKRLRPSITHSSPSRRALVLAAVVEEAHVVFLEFERFDLVRDERIDLLEQRDDLRRHVRVGVFLHRSSLASDSVIVRYVGFATSSFARAVARTAANSSSSLAVSVR